MSDGFVGGDRKYDELDAFTIRPDRTYKVKVSPRTPPPGYRLAGRKGTELMDYGVLRACEYPSCATRHKGWFPEIGLPPKSSIFMGFSIINQPFLGIPHLWNPPNRFQMQTFKRQCHHPVPRHAAFGDLQEAGHEDQRQAGISWHDFTW